MKQLTTIYKKIQYALNDLPGESAHKEMYPGRKSAKEVRLEDENYRTAAVLAMLYEESKTIKLVLTQRQTYQGNHSNQISFPGGKIEQYDRSVEDAALRETEEEIGVNRQNIEIIGKLTDVYIPVSKFMVHPFIGKHEGVPNFTLEEREVQRLISIDLFDLLDQNVLTTEKIKISSDLILKDVPAFNFNGDIVWGATALMLNEIKHLLRRIDF